MLVSALVLAFSYFIAPKPDPGTSETGAVSQVDTPPPYPAPLETSTPAPALVPPATVGPEDLPTITPTATQPFPDMQSMAPVEAAVLHGGDIYLAALDRSQALTDSGDVAAIFGWNRDGTKLIYGKGRVQQAEYHSDTTDLWYLDANTNQSTQLTMDHTANSAAWAPTDDRIAYTNKDVILRVIDLGGKELARVERALLSFTWSPDGSSLAIETYTPETVDSDGMAFTVLALWHPSDGKLVYLSQAKDEVHAWPIFSTDGSKIMYLNSFFDPAEQAQSGLFIYDLASGEITPVEGETDGETMSLQRITRSPRSDLVAVYGLEDQIFTLDFEGKINPVASGAWPQWLLDGKTIVYQDPEGVFQTVTVEEEAGDKIIGGGQYSVSMYLTPIFYFRPGDAP